MANIFSKASRDGAYKRAKAAAKKAEKKAGILYRKAVAKAKKGAKGIGKVKGKKSKKSKWIWKKVRRK